VDVLGIIPARFGATRFPGKPLALISGKTLVQRVWERAIRCQSLDGLVVATEDERIYEHVAGFGGRPVMTRADHASGTDRLGEVAEREYADYYVNIQGDEPLLDPVAVDTLVTRTVAAAAAMSTLVSPFAPHATADEISNPNVVKAVRDAEGFALYFSRSPIPYPRNAEAAAYLQHIGIYMYSRETLAKLCSWPPVAIERAESLEQLRALYNGVRILTVDCGYSPVSVDTPEDAKLVELRLAELKLP
jgi:3-deoxy-manno-octulosonate cytidylyltransferase (CMP-KDO synthetase)